MNGEVPPVQETLTLPVLVLTIVGAGAARAETTANKMAAAAPSSLALWNIVIV